MHGWSNRTTRGAISERSVLAWLRGKLGGECGRRQPADTGMWAHGVVVAPPFLECGARLGERGEEGLVQELVAQPGVEALDEGILCRLSRRDVVPLDAGFRGPGEDGVAGQLRAVVADGGLWFAVPGDQIGRSGSRATLLPESKKSAIAARHRRVQTS
jgi:hypothetical protein